MSDHYVKVKVQLEQMKSSGEDAEKEGVVNVEEEPPQEVPVGSPPASVSPLTLPPSTTTAGRRDASKTPITCKHRSKSRSKQGKDEKNSGSKQNKDPALHGPVVAANVGKNLNRLQIKGTGKILQGKAETNGNIAPNHRPIEINGTPKEHGNKPAKKKRPVTVDTSKAKTSLEALKLSVKQLKWREVLSALNMDHPVPFLLRV